MKNSPFDSLVWGSLRLAPIIKFSKKQEDCYKEDTAKGLI